LRVVARYGVPMRGFGFSKAKLPAFLIYTIALVVVTGCEIERSRGWGRALSIRDKSIRIAGDMNGPAIFGKVSGSSRENIVVFNPPPKIEKSFAVLAIDNALWRYESIKRRDSALKFKLRRDRAGRDIFFYGVENISLRKPLIQDFACNVHPH
jgi:hypothetical protein